MPQKTKFENLRENLTLEEQKLIVLAENAHRDFLAQSSDVDLGGLKFVDERLITVLNQAVSTNDRRGVLREGLKDTFEGVVGAKFAQDGRPYLDFLRNYLPDEVGRKLFEAAEIEL
ncbi:hypothetical protein [Roseovarius amoyensis]|uniref:hypothetical protein n=1 Tax=Roseovarius amoyensis TaxID=2211448 RepID=UPI0013A6991C|nr:hypothetical protein [Roseovarius amoyensis]